MSRTIDGLARAVLPVGMALVTLAFSGCGGTRAPAPAVERAARTAPVDVAEEDEHPYPLYPRIASRTGPQARLRALRAPRAVGRLYYGLLHSHTLYSDGSGTPQDAFARARAQHLDFFGVSEHNHARAEDGASGSRRDGVVLTPELYADPAPVTVTRHWREDGQAHTETVTAPSLVAAARAANTSGFVALYGQEFSSISKGNHVNVFMWDDVLAVPNGDFKAFYELLRASASPPLVQMNHPSVHDDMFYAGHDSATRNAMFNDYGFDDYQQDFAKLASAAEPLIRLIEILSGPAMAEQTEASYHYAHQHENDYYYYLCQGLHVSPSAGHDNHYRTWGNTTPARMGVYASALTADALASAMRGNRTFATEDPDLRLEWELNAQQMGSTLTAAAGTTLQMSVRVEDPTDSGTEYVVNLYHGEVAPQRAQSLRELIARDGLVDAWQATGDGELQLVDRIATGGPEFFYVRITQGDGDRAWSAPIWLNHPRSGS
jgi:hypothetical protein